MPDHVHLLVKTPTRLAPARLMQQVKGVSSHFTHDRLAECEGFFWQEGYGVFSVGRNQRQAVIAYIANQKQHHAANTLHTAWEETDEEYTPKRAEP